MLKLIPIILVFLFAECTTHSKNTTLAKEEVSTILNTHKEEKNSADLMVDSEAILLQKREVIDQLIDTLNDLYFKKYGKSGAASRMVFLRESQALFVKYKDAMRDVYCYDSGEYGSGWSENEFIYNYVITLMDARIQQLDFLKANALEKN